MKIFNSVLIITLISISLLSCNTKSGKEETLAPSVQKIVAEEVFQTNNYTYIKGTENKKEVWVAVSKQEVKVGGTYYYVEDIGMDNFTSKELKRTFEKISFAQAFSDQPIALANGKPVTSPGSMKASPDKVTVTIEPVDGGITLAQLFEKRNSYAGKTVKIAGQVIKVNTQIMGSNWVHIQDGTDHKGEFDLTVTTKDEAQVGEFIVVEGTIALDKDFGAGYAYDVIMENAKVTKK